MNCPICKGKTQFIYRFSNEPIMQNNLYNSLGNALQAKKANVALYGCRNCGFVFNASFNSKNTKYSSQYNNSQEYSSYFSRYLERIARKLIKRYNLKNKNVVEIGCGKGYFLKLLYDWGVNNIKGFDPSYINFNPLIDKLAAKEYFDISNIKRKVDFVVCRHTLEHISNPKEFISSIGRCLKDEGTMYFEFPDLEWIIKNKTFFDFFYEHCNYFTKSSIVALFNQFGFNNIRFDYGLKGQYFQLEISRFPKREYNFQPINLTRLSQDINKKIKAYKKVIDGLDNFVIWGAGAKGVTFLNRLNVSRHRCQYVIDINPNKQNKFIPGTGQKIVSPEILGKEKIDDVIIMNSIYEKEIKNLSVKYNYRGKFILL
jgi:SAM-dependent methyltransferase